MLIFISFFNPLPPSWKNKLLTLRRKREWLLATLRDLLQCKIHSPQFIFNYFYTRYSRLPGLALWRELISVPILMWMSEESTPRLLPRERLPYSLLEQPRSRSTIKSSAFCAKGQYKMFSHAIYSSKS